MQKRPWVVFMYLTDNDDVNSRPVSEMLLSDISFQINPSQLEHWFLYHLFGSLLERSYYLKVDRGIELLKLTHKQTVTSFQWHGYLLHTAFNYSWRCVHVLQGYWCDSGPVWSCFHDSHSHMEVITWPLTFKVNIKTIHTFCCLVILFNMICISA